MDKGIHFTNDRLNIIETIMDIFVAKGERIHKVAINLVWF